MVAAVPSAASAAASKPTVQTKAAADITQSTVTLTGSVNPEGAATTYFFQIGPTSLYGSDTETVSAGSGTAVVNVSAPVTGLAPATTYHYRLVARNAKGIVKGPDRTFKTKRQPLGLVLGASVNPIPFGGATVLTGQLTGTGNAEKRVALQANPFPYSQGFAQVGNILLTDANGAFSFPLIGLGVNTQYRVVMPERDTVVSPILSVGVRVKVGTSATPRRVRRGGRVRFSGRITPAAPGARVEIQRRGKGKWVTVARTVARTAPGATSSTYRRRAAIRKSGRYRVLVNVVDGAHVTSHGRTVRLRTHR